MAYVFNGAGTARLRRAGGLIASTNPGTVLFAIKRTGTQTDKRVIFTLRKYGGGDTGHDVVINDVAASAQQAPALAANFYTGGLSAVVDTLPANAWAWLALIGNGTTLTLASRLQGASAWVTATRTQTPFVPTEIVVGDDGSGTKNTIMKLSDIREWNAALSLSELTAEIASGAAVRSGSGQGLVSAKSGVGATLAAALLGEVGSAFTNLGAVTIDTDRPVFGPIITGTAILPTAATSESTETTVTAAATEGPDVGTATATHELTITAEATEGGDVGGDSVAPTAQIFASSATVTTTNPVDITVQASDDDSGVSIVELFRDDVLVASWLTGGQHTFRDSFTNADNGTHVYRARVTDNTGNQSTQPTVTVTVNISLGQFAVDLTLDATTISTPGGAAGAAITVPGSITIDSVVLLVNGVQSGAAVSGPPYLRSLQFFSPSENGTYSIQARVTSTAGVVALSPVRTLVVSLPGSAVIPPLQLGLADMIEIPRRETIRAIQFDLKDAQSGNALPGANPSVQISLDNGPFAAPAGQVAETSVPGRYVFMPGEADVNVEGLLTITVQAANAAPVAPIQARVVTPYGKR